MAIALTKRQKCEGRLSVNDWQILEARFTITI